MFACKNEYVENVCTNKRGVGCENLSNGRIRKGGEWWNVKVGKLVKEKCVDLGEYLKNK